MEILKVIFWIALGIVFYTYIGYGSVLFVWIKLNNIFSKGKKEQTEDYEPEVTLLITAFNEKDMAYQKVQNSNELDYPSEKIHQVWVTDGSYDGTPEMLKEFDSIRVLHQSERKGKIAAMNRAMKHVKTPIVIFTDANTLVSKQAIRRIVAQFTDPKTGCVSGEKRVAMQDKDAAAGSGEGFYWKYESTLKKWDSELNTAVGAAGELFAIRTELFHEVEPDTILDDFMISLRLAMQGYKIKYDPEAYAVETASANVKEELKRKIRIAAGGIQSILRLLPLLNIFKHKLLSFQYISHRVLRWTITPLMLPLLLIINILLANTSVFYSAILISQIAFYALVLIGWMLENLKVKVKSIYIPYYFFIMNYAVYRGFFRFMGKKQSVNWERAKRT